MRAFDFVKEDETSSDQYSHIVTALSHLKQRVDQGELSPEIPTQFIVRMIRNSGLATATIDDLIAANEASPAIKNILKQITKDTTTFNTNTEQPVTNADTDIGAVDNPQKTVSNMAKAAMKRRQK